MRVGPTSVCSMPSSLARRLESRQAMVLAGTDQNVKLSLLVSIPVIITFAALDWSMLKRPVQPFEKHRVPHTLETKRSCQINRFKASNNFWKAVVAAGFCRCLSSVSSFSQLLMAGWADRFAGDEAR